MRLTNNAIGMPFEAFHWGAIQIPFVVNHHLHKGEREAVQNRKPSSELKYSLKYLDHYDRRSVTRFLGAVEEMVSKNMMKELVGMGSVPRLRALLLEDDHKIVFETECAIVKAVSKDPKGLFSGELIKEDGLNILLDLMMIEDSQGSGRMKNGSGEHYSMMIRGNALYIIGYMIGNGLGSSIMDREMVDLLLERSNDDDPVSRGNALFCFRMSLERGDEVRYDTGRVLSRAMVMLEDPDPMVREEAVRSVQCLLESELVTGDSVLGAAERIEGLSRSGSLETTKAAEAVLYMLKETG
ncbi:MAG: hypothetical protein JXA22_07715 [Candidatus Thermoplasmatota archaeon]|nr:hypothetical protein [Candidatus Thermoplasmatota archaeon]